MRQTEKMLKTMLVELEGKRNSESFPGMIAGAYALWLGKQENVIDIENLSKFLEKAEPDDDIRHFVQTKLNDHWNEYRHYITVFESELLKQAILDMIPKDIGFSFWHSPELFLELVTQILNIAPRDRVADFGAGTGEFLCHAYKKVPQAHFWGNELATVSVTIAKIRAKLLGGDITLVQEDMFNVDSEKEHKFDKAFCFPPLGMRLSRMSRTEEFLKTQPASLPELKGTVSGEWVFALKLLSCLKEGGRAVLALSPGGLFSMLDNEVRRYLLWHQLVEAVILLPAKLFDVTTSPIALVVFSQNHSDIRMIDASGMGEEKRRNVVLRSEDIEQILAALDGKSFDWSAIVDYRDVIVRGNMNPAHYTDDTLNLKDAIVFGDIIMEISRGASLSAAELDVLTSKEATAFQYLACSNIKNGMIEEDLPYLSALDNRQMRSCLRQGDIVLTKIGNPSFKVALAEPRLGQNVLANGNLFVIRVKENIADPCYVKVFLESELGQAVLTRASRGSIMPNLSVEAIKNMHISLPPLDQQQKIVERYRAKADEVVILQRKLNTALNALMHIIDL